jgi:catechol 2,3-dioxygenase-like lactoylglutathione lyase family enzyme
VPTVNHVGLTVSDLDVSLDFYCSVVGFSVGSRRRIQGEWFDTLTHNTGADIDVAMLNLGEVTLQLVQYLAAGGERLPLAHHHVGSPHLCITVDDVDARHATVSASGRHRPTPVVDIMGTGIRSFYVEDPDGVPVELLQYPGGAR